MNRSILIVLVVISATWTSCSVEPEAINYGTDQCSYCRMNIVDQQHAAQFVTSKGKQFKFDAIECMINDLGDKPDLQLAHILVVRYDMPGISIPASEAHYLISEGIPSPMGANLSAFGDIHQLEDLKAKLGGERLDWNTLRSTTFK